MQPTGRLPHVDVALNVNSEETAMTLENPLPLTCIALCVLGMTPCAHAADSLDRIPTREVSFAGLNLTKQTDVQRLYRRIAAAADQVCDTVPGQTDLATKARVKRCMAETIARAVVDVNAPLLTQYHDVKTGQAESRVALSKPR
jgi:UrcA family protein